MSLPRLSQRLLATGDQSQQDQPDLDLVTISSHLVF
jgi:hypothetical protein